MSDRAKTLDRRQFLVAGTLGTGALGTALAWAGSSSAGTSPSTAPTSAGTTSAADPSFPLNEVTVSELQDRMARGELTAEQITQLYLDRIAQIDRQGPTLRSVIETNPEALEIARALDRERQQQGPRGPLHGIPILLKDNIATADKMTTTAGSLALAGSIPAKDSFVAAKLRAAGAVLLGKTNMSEWANFRSQHSSSGWSGRGGQCKNPYALDRNPCGSSSGSGAAIAANLAAVAIGTETNGSIVCPANANGLVGIKPTLGLVSRSRIIPIAHSQDTAGPMARTVRDAAIVLGALTGVDAEDEATQTSVGHAHTDYTVFLAGDGLRGVRLGVARAFFGFDPRVDALMEAALKALSGGGAVLVDPVQLPSMSEVSAAAVQVLNYEFKAGLNAYLQALGPSAPIRSLRELIAWNEQNRERELPYFGQDRLLTAEEKGTLDAPEYREALTKAKRLTQADGIDKVMSEHQLDALVGPTGGPAWLTDLVNGDNYSGGSSTPAAVAGYPNITVPAGAIFGLPVGISFFGRAWSEPTLLKIAYAYEQATQHRRPPQFLPSADLG